VLYSSSSIIPKGASSPVGCTNSGPAICGESHIVIVCLARSPVVLGTVWSVNETSSVFAFDALYSIAPYGAMHLPGVFYSLAVSTTVSQDSRLLVRASGAVCKVVLRHTDFA